MCHLTTGRGNSRDRLESIFHAIKQESNAACSQRWRGHFDRSKGPSHQIVLFGSGALGLWVLQRLRHAGVEPCCFADNDPARWGTSIDRLEVLSPSDAVARFGRDVSYVVTIYNGSAARKQLRGLGCFHVLPVLALFWKHPNEFMPNHGIDSPERLVEDEPQIRECFESLSDEVSRHGLCDQVQWRYWLEPDFLDVARDAGEMYFPDDLVLPNSEEIFVDCGAFDGDTIRSFLRRQKSFRRLYALEPDGANRSALLAYLAQQNASVREQVTVWPFAVTDVDGSATFLSTHNVASKLSSSGNGNTQECRALDSMEWTLAPTYIKMDIEGSEPEALAGGKRLIQRAMPVLAVCLYHRSEHLWQIPNLIHSIEPRYSLFLRRYAEDCWETVCYAVPQHRLVRN